MNNEKSFQNFDLPSLIRSFENCVETVEVLENIKTGINFLATCDIEDVENLLKHIMPAIIQVMKQVYDENIVLVQSNKTGILNSIKSNFQVTLALMDISNDVLECTMEHGTVQFIHIPSIPVNMAQVLLLTFDHCKHSQITYSSSFKSVTEIFDLFRKTQEVHTKFLHFLDACLVFDFLNHDEVIVIEDLLAIFVKISEMLSGVNIKSLAENWKGFVSLTQKYSDAWSTNSFNLSLPVNSLTLEISNNLQMIMEWGPDDLVKCTQTLKITGFLIKIALKLFEAHVRSIENSFDEILTFCLAVFSWHCGFFQNNKFPDEFAETVKNLLFLNTESFVSQLVQDNIFLKKFSQVDQNHCLLSTRSFGFVHFSIELFKRLPILLKEEPEMAENFEFVNLLYVIFSCTKNCFKEYYWDYNSKFYDELVTNISVAVLLFPNYYEQTEKILLECVAQDKIWTALIATDIWCTVLRCVPVGMCRSTLNALIVKMQQLNLGIFVQTPALIYLKILIYRILKILPNSVVNETVSEYNTSNLSAWKILNIGIITLPQRFHIEFILSDLFDKVDAIEKEKYSLNETVSLMEGLNIISNAKFNALEMNTSKLVSCINRLWSFDASDLSSSNNFYKYVVYSLTRVTAAVTRELTADNLLVILNQLKQLFNETLFKLLTCDILRGISRRNFDDFQKKSILFSLVADIFQALLTDKNPIVIETALETFQEISENRCYESVTNRILTNSSQIKKYIASFMRRSATDTKYSSKYFENLQKSEFRHRCLEWSNSDLPLCKKMKMENDVEDVINTLKVNTEKLSKAVVRSQLNSRQLTDVRNVINKLEKVLL